jgi:phage terminase large subunit
LLVEECLLSPGENGGAGLRAVCIREVQKSLKESSKRIIEDALQKYGLGEREGFKVFSDVIKTPGDGVIVFHGMQDHTAESVKSMEGFSRAWVEEAQTLSERSLQLLRPTIRAPGSQLWFSWNPRRKTDPVDAMLRGTNPPSNAAVVRANWADNPYFPEVLEQERQDCLRNDPDQYAHIWEGDYASVSTGAYFAKGLAEARSHGRIGRVSADPLMTIRLFWDIGGTGARADACAIWAVQIIGKEIRVLDYYESVGQPLAVHLDWMRSRGYTPERAQVWLPHDGAQQDKVYAVSYESALRQAGYFVSVVPNQGKGAARQRIEAVRRWLPACWFNEYTTAAGLEALGWYHEKRDEARGIGLGPEHDWSSHAADAFGLMAICAEQLFDVARPKTQHNTAMSGGWMG